MLFVKILSWEISGNWEKNVMRSYPFLALWWLQPINSSPPSPPSSHRSDFDVITEFWSGSWKLWGWICLKLTDSNVVKRVERHSNSWTSQRQWSAVLDSGMTPSLTVKKALLSFVSSIQLQQVLTDKDKKTLLISFMRNSKVCHKLKDENRRQKDKLEVQNEGAGYVYIHSSNTITFFLKNWILHSTYPLSLDTVTYKNCQKAKPLITASAIYCSTGICALTSILV